MTKRAMASCDVCAAHKPANVTGLRDMVFTHKDEPPWLKTPKEVDEYPGVTKHTDQRHRVRAEDVLGQYDFRGNDWRSECSFPGRHRNAKGFIVETICKLRLKIGHKCGGDSIDGMKEAEQRFNAARTYFAAKASIERLATELPRTLPTDEIQALLVLKRGLSELFPHIAKELREVDRPFRFAGAGLWRGQPTPPVLALRAKLEDLVRLSKAMRPDRPAREAVALAKKFDRISPDVREARRWCDAAAPFATGANLKAVFDAFGVAAHVDDTGIATITGKGDRPFRLGLGVYELKAKGR